MIIKVILRGKELILQMGEYPVWGLYICINRQLCKIKKEVGGFEPMTYSVSGKNSAI